MDRCDRPACELRLYVDRDGCLRVGLTDDDNVRHEAVRVIGRSASSLFYLIGEVLGAFELEDRFEAATGTVPQRTGGE